MENLIQKAIEHAPEINNSNMGATFWVMVGIVLTIQVADKLVYWLRQFKGRNGEQVSDRHSANIHSVSADIRELQSNIKHAVRAFDRHTEQDRREHDTFNQRFVRIADDNKEHFNRIYNQLLDLQKNKADK